MLKAQLHIHSGEDPQDGLHYKAKDVIDMAKKLNFDVISFTFHNTLFYNQEIINYAKNNGWDVAGMDFDSNAVRVNDNSDI